MSGTRTFFRLHYDLMASPAYRAFFATTANLTYTLLLSHVYRPTRTSDPRHALRPFYDVGWLCTQISLRDLAREYPERGRTGIERDIRHLEKLQLLHTYDLQDNSPTLYVLGRWGWVEPDDRLRRSGRDRWEFFYVDHIFGNEELPWE